MENNHTHNWKKAIEIYTEISQLSVSHALSHLNHLPKLSYEIKQVVITLINLGGQATQYIEKNFTPNDGILEQNLPEYKSGYILGEYQLLEKLGQGGMSQVFKAKRLNSDPQKLVAIKIFIATNNTKELLNHFISEQKILSEFSHHNIVDMLHGGKSTDDTAYLVMELIEGALPIDKYCQHNNSKTKQKIVYIADCARALAYSHANLIIHRDIKPDNILIGEDKKLKIVDFGIAKLMSNDSRSTDTIMALTPKYAAPEQINSQQITVKTDIFSLAIVGIELFIKDGNEILPNDRLIKSCVNDQQYLDKAINELKLDKDLKNIFQQASAIDNHKRYANMHLFAEDLTNWLSNKPVNATAPSLFYRIQKFAIRRRALFATLMTLMLTLSLGFLILLWQYQKTKVAELKATEVKKFILDAYTQTNPDIAQGKEVTAADILNQTAKKLEGSKLDKKVKFELLQTIGIAYGQIGQASKGADFLKKSLVLNPNDSKSLSYRIQFLNQAENNQELNNLLKKIDIEQIASEQDRARIYRVIARNHAQNLAFNKAQNSLNKAIELTIRTNDFEQEIRSKKLLAEFYFLQSKASDGIKILENLLNKPHLDDTSSLAMEIKSDLNTLYTDSGDYDKAYDGWNNLIAQQRKILGNKHPELAVSLTQLSGVYRQKNDLKNAQQAIQEAHNINLEEFGQDNIITARTLSSLALLSYRLGDVKKALAQMFQVLKVYEETQGSDFSETLKIKTNLAAYLLLNNRMDEALILSQELYDIQLKKLGPEHNATIYSQYILAKTLLQLNKLEQAYALAKLGYDNSITHLGYKNPLTSAAHFLLASIYEKQDKNKEALVIYQQILKRDLVAKNSPYYPELMSFLAHLYVKTKDFKNADNFYKKSIDANILNYGEDHKNTLKAKKKYAEYLKNHHPRHMVFIKERV